MGCMKIKKSITAAVQVNTIDGQYNSITGSQTVQGTTNMHAYRQSNSSGNSKHACMQWKYILVVVQHNARLEQIMLKQTMAAAWHNQIIM